MAQQVIHKMANNLAGKWLKSSYKEHKFSQSSEILAINVSDCTADTKNQGSLSSRRWDSTNMQKKKVKPRKLKCSLYVEPD